MSYAIYYSQTTGEISTVISFGEGSIDVPIPPEGFIGAFVPVPPEFPAYYENGTCINIGYSPSSSHVFNWATKQWEDPRTLADLKSAKWEQVKAQRDAAEFGLFTWAGHAFDGDEAAQRRINLAVMGAQAALIAGDAAWSVDWTLADNTSLTLSASDMMGVANALGANIAQAHTSARAKRQQIQAATSVAELEAL